MYHTKDWIDIVAAFAPAVAVAVAVGVAVMQAYLQQKQLDQDLFDKRFEVYSAVRWFLSVVLKGIGTVDGETYYRFTSATRPAKFLFGSDVMDFLREIQRCMQPDKTEDGQFSKVRLEPEYVDIFNPDPHIDSGTVMLIWGKRAEDTFRRYLNLYKEHSWVVRCIARADRWMDQGDKALASRYERGEVS